jgi:elongation factor Ts
MAEYTKEDIVALREQTAMGLSDIKKALEEANGNREKALELLRERGAAVMAKRADRETGEGVIVSYIHAGRIGVMVEVNCETDFVARSEDFRNFADSIALHITSMAPETTEELLEQDFFQDSKKTVSEYLAEVTGKLGEKVMIRRFVRIELGK